jgi:putative transposase
MLAFKKGQVIWRQDVEWEVVKSDLPDSGGAHAQVDVVVENRVSAMRERKKTTELLAEYVAGSLKVCEDKFAQLRGSHQGNSSVDDSSGALPPTASEAGRIETLRRMDYIVRLERERAFGVHRRNLAQKVLAISIERGELRPPHVATVYRWYQTYQRSMRQAQGFFCRFDRRGGAGRARLQGEVEAIILEQIDEVYLSKPVSSAEELLDAVCLHVDRYNQTQVPSRQLQRPSLRTIQRRLSSLCAFELAVARYGQREAERRFANCLGARPVSRILEIVEIDHTPIDCLIVDKDRVVIGRPWVTVALDRHSRVVLGYHLSLAGHGTEAVFEALRHALMPKTYLRTRYADLNLTWPCHGWPERMVMDNGREFHAEAVVQSLVDIGVISEYAASREPNDKPHVERFIKTLNYCLIHRLAGTTLARVHKRVGFSAEDTACLTLEELDKIIHVWICDKYHLRPNRGLKGRAPLDVWNEGCQSNPPQLKRNARDLEIVFCRFAQSSIQNDGIDLNTFKFVSAELLVLRSLLPPKSRVHVRWPWHDAGHIWVWDQLSHKYLRVPNKDQSLAGLTVEQAKTALKALAKDTSEYRAVAATADETNRAIQAQAAAHKKLAVRRKAARLANMTSKPLRDEPSSGNLAGPRPSVPVVTGSSEEVGSLEHDDAPFAFELAVMREGGDQ